MAPSKATPLGDLALLALRDRLARTPPKDPIAAAINRSLRLEERRHRAVHAAFAAQAAPVRSSLQDPAQLPTPAQMAVRDGREGDIWFRDLPLPEQQRLRAKWAYDKTRFDGLTAHTWKQRVGIAGSGVAVFGAIGVLQTMIFGLGVVPWMMGLGAIAGLGWSFAPLSRTWLALFGVLVYLPGMAPWAFPATVFSLVGLFCGAWLVTHLGAVIAIEHEAKMRGGFLAMPGPPVPKAAPLSERPPAPAASPPAGSASPTSVRAPAGAPPR